MNEEELRDALHASKPPSPDVTGWAAAGRGRARNRRVVVGAVAVLLGLGIALPVVLQIPNGTGPMVLATPVSAEPTDPSPSPVLSLPSERGEGLVPNVCADIQSGKVTPGTLAATEQLEPGAARVWLCGDLNDPFGGAIGPIEPLTTDPDRVVEAINALPATTTDFCTAIGGLTYHVAIDYPNGERRILPAETVNCEYVGGWNGRTGGRELLEVLKGFWNDQRNVTPSFTDEVNLCGTYPTGYESGGGGINSFLPVERKSVVRGAVCGLAASSVDFTGATIQHDLPQELVDAIATAGLPSKEAYNVPLGLPYVVLVNEHGDPVTYAVDEKLAIVFQDEAVEWSPWQPQGDAAPLWRAALDGLRTAAFYSTPAECVEDYTLTADADLNGIVAGWACVNSFAIPAKVPTLDPEFAAELGRRFNAEAVPATTGSFNTANEVRFRDAAGNLSPLSWNGQMPVTLVDHDSKRAWTVPEHIVEELRRYGLAFDVDD